MPSSVVKTKEQEKKWKLAKKRAKEEGQEDNYAYIMSIYKKMTGYESKDESKKESLAKYLQNKLTVSLKDAQLIESVIKRYIADQKRK
jgi:hypothetical protein